MEAGNGAEAKTKREHAYRLIGHPLNRAYFEKVLTMLKEGGVYGWIDMQEVFTREEIEQALKAPQQ